VLEPAPTVHDHVKRNHAQPEVLPPECKTDKRHGTQKTDYRCDHQAPGAAKHKPEQGTQNLATIQGIDRKNVKSQQAGVDPEYRWSRLIEIEPTVDKKIRVS
jgi:hypothetical protein